MLLTESAYNKNNSFTTAIYNQQINKNQQISGKRENLISRVTTLLDSNVQFSTTKSQGIQRNKSMVQAKEKKINKNYI